MKCLLNIKLYIFLFTLFPNIQGPKRKRTSIVDDISAKRPYKPLIKDCKITYYWFKYRMWYELNNFLFKKHRDVIAYYNKLCFGVLSNKDKRPEGAAKRNFLKVNSNFLKLAEYSYPDILKSNPFTDFIWKRIWYGCDFNCYAKNQFELLKIGFLTELNEYRRLHGVKPLVMDPLLQEKAEKQAKKNAPPFHTKFKDNRFIGHIGANCRVEQANILMKKMYEILLSNYDWYNKTLNSISRVYLQLIWKHTQKIGVGVWIKDDHIYIAFLFSPKGCAGNFNKNVYPITQKHLYMFNLFEKNRLIRHQDVFKFP
uniref:SCP domain-containing protein n=1 Tax=Strongyloides papillosus TaxID=174720 RepID=A0A0N5B5V6_STREA